MDENYAVRRSDEIEREIKLKFYPPPKGLPMPPHAQTLNCINNIYC